MNEILQKYNLVKLTKDETEYHIWVDLYVQEKFNFVIKNLSTKKITVSYCNFLCRKIFNNKGMGREEGSGWGERVYLWRIYFDVWQN